MTRPSRGPSVEWLRADCAAEAQVFLDRHWKHGHVLARDKELLHWQHRRAGEPDLLSILIARDAHDEAVGLLGVIDAPFCLRGRRLRAGWLTTWVVPPEQRAGAVGLVLLRKLLADDDVDVLGTTGGNATTQRLLGGLGFETTDALPRWVLPLSWTGLNRILAATGREYDPAALEAWHDACDPSAGSLGTGGYEVHAWSRDGEAWDRCWANVLAPHIVGTWRDAAYLGWRYLDHPSFRYQLLVASHPGNLEPSGLVAYRLQSVQGVEEIVVRVVELLGDDAAMGALAGAVTDAAQDAGAAFVDFYCSSRHATRALEHAGFLRDDELPDSLPALFQPLDGRRTELTAALRIPADGGGFSGWGDVYLTRSDCDQDRPN